MLCSGDPLIGLRGDGMGELGAVDLRQRGVERFPFRGERRAAVHSEDEGNTNLAHALLVDRRNQEVEVTRKKFRDVAMACGDDERADLKWTAARRKHQR